MEEQHIPVLLSEVLEVLQPQRGESYLDLTAGYAGHASEILDVTRNYKGSTLVDRDENAIRVLAEKYGDAERRGSELAEMFEDAEARTEAERPRDVEARTETSKDAESDVRFGREGLRIVHKDFYNAVLQEIECGRTYDMILADFGVSSPQLDQAERGFSFSKDGPLDMRMDQREDLTAERIVNGWGEREIAEILEKYGEEKPGFAKMIARAIVQGRPWKSTGELGTMLAKYGRGGRVHPATRTFQAIRIAVNRELEEIEQTLPLLLKVLKPGGRVALITFHSLEDRIVKDYFREVSSHGEESELEVLTRKPIVAGKMELVINPRARSAKLRAARKK